MTAQDILKYIEEKRLESKKDLKVFKKSSEKSYLCGTAQGFIWCCDDLIEYIKIGLNEN